MRWLVILAALLTLACAPAQACLRIAERPPQTVWYVFGPEKGCFTYSMTATGVNSHVCGSFSVIEGACQETNDGTH